MKMWTFTALILTLVLGLSLGALVIGHRHGLLKNAAHYLLVGLLGIAISAIFMVLIIIAVWPPYNAISFILTFGFVALVLGVLYFVRSTNPADLTEGE